MAEPAERDELEGQEKNFGEQMPSRDENAQESGEQTRNEQSEDSSEHDADESWLDKATDFGSDQLKKRT